jgi:hypothetical protein
MPPFLGGVMVSHDGEVWVTRTGAPRDTVTVIDVFDAKGTLVRRVGLIGAARLVGFGPRSVFAVRGSRFAVHGSHGQ